MRAALQRGTSQRGLRQPLLAVLEAGPGDQMRAGAAVRAIAMLPRSGVVCVMHDDGTVCGYVHDPPPPGADCAAGRFRVLFGGVSAWFLCMFSAARRQG
jgi:hypothetical protein